MVMVRTGGVDWLRMLYCEVWKDSPSELLLLFYSNIRRGKRVVEIVAQTSFHITMPISRGKPSLTIRTSGISKRNNAPMF